MTTSPSLSALKKQFRTAITERLPQCLCTVKSYSTATKLYAECTQSRGFNRVATVRIQQHNLDNTPHFTVSFAGFGKRATVQGTGAGPSLDAAIDDLLRALPPASHQAATRYGTFERADTAQQA